MQITFMPKKRSQSVNFLQKFRGKVNRVDRYSGILGALRGNSSRYESIQQEGESQRGRNSDKTGQPLKVSRGPKNIRYVSTKPTNQQATENVLNKTRALRFCKPLKTEQSHQDKENTNCMNFQETVFLLPKLNVKSSKNSKYINRINPQLHTRKSSRICQKEESNHFLVNRSSRQAQ